MLVGDGVALRGLRLPLGVFARPSALSPPTMETNRRLYVARWRLAGTAAWALRQRRSITASGLPRSLILQ